jgi:phage terminase large subunit-like protein
MAKRVREEDEILLEDIPIEQGIFVDPDEFTRVVVGVDPAMTSGAKSDETGIIVAARGPHQSSTCHTRSCVSHAYVLQDATIPKGEKSDPDTWARRVLEMFDTWNADTIVVEDNAMKELADVLFLTLRTGLPIQKPWAGESKKARAEPIVALYEQGRVHHVGPSVNFAKLEEQMTTWVPPEQGKRSRVSPDRLDALVWAIAELKIQGSRRAPIKSTPAWGAEKTNEWEILGESSWDNPFGTML